MMLRSSKTTILTSPDFKKFQDDYWCSPIQDQDPQALMDSLDGVHMISDFEIPIISLDIL